MRIQRTLGSKCVWDHLLIWEKKFPYVKLQRVRMHCGVWGCHIEGVFLLVSHGYTLQCLSERYSLIQSTHQVLFFADHLSPSSQKSGRKPKGLIQQRPSSLDAEGTLLLSYDN